MPNAIGKSKVGPSFFTSAGARLMVVRPIGNLKPELLRAVVTRSRDSFTAASGRPTMTISVSPQPALTSTSTGKPLRDRREDIPLLADYFLREFTTAYGRKPKELTPEAYRILQDYHWPGNVRELRNMIERIVILNPQNPVS